MSEGTREEPQPRRYTRREFLGFLGNAALIMGRPLIEEGLGLGPSGRLKDEAGKHEAKPSYLQPEIVHGVEVYGLGEEKIRDESQIHQLHWFLDRQFLSPIKMPSLRVLGGLAWLVLTKTRLSRESNFSLRGESLDPAERYLQVVVRQSAYDSFLRRRGETGVDFVEWIKMHVEAMNLFFEHAKPPSAMRAVLRRIIVIADDLPRGFWDEAAFRRNEGPNLDLAWKRRYDDPLDTDCAWAIPDDYRPEDMPDEMVYGFFWQATTEEDEVIFRRSDVKETYVYPISPTSSFRGKRRVWLDIGLIHEWLHYLLNLPDEYVFDCHDPSQRFSPFYFRTGYFHEPKASPFLSSLADYQIRRGLRNDVFQGYGRGYSFKEVPPYISLEVVRESLDQNTPVTWQLYLPTRNSQEARIFGSVPSAFGCDSGRIKFKGADIFKEDPCTILLKTGSYEIYLPSALFMMSKMVGIQRCNCQIRLTGYDNPEAKIQFVELVDDSDLSTFLQTRENEGLSPYAMAKANGTNTWFVWFIK